MSSSPSDSPASLNLRNVPNDVIDIILKNNEELVRDEATAKNPEQLRIILKATIKFSRERHRRNFKLCLEEIKYIGKLKGESSGEVNLDDIPDEFLEQMLEHKIGLLKEGAIAANPGKKASLNRTITHLSQEQHRRKFNLCLKEMIPIIESKKHRRYRMLRWLAGININEIIPYNQLFTTPLSPK